MLDIVDQNDTVVGQKSKREVYAQKLTNFRVINAFLINAEKKLWIPRRSGHKKLFPLCLDTSVGGHVITKETYDQALIRESAEELNINLLRIGYQFFTKLTPHQNNVSAYMHVYLIYTNLSPCYNKNDFIEASWFTIDELQNLIKNGEKTKGDLPTLINILEKYVNSVELS